MATDSLLFSEKDQQRIIEAIKQAETQTSGEVKVHIEKKCPAPDVMERAKEVFLFLNLHRTALQNGVLFYLAYEDRKFAVLGDKGINEKVPHDFWNSTKDLLKQHFAKGEFIEGLVHGIAEAGFQLKIHFPYNSNDINELPDDISFGK
ncbi:TPM domain-containing protein [Dyadobacter chenwenxiniae]|uniref:TPM domain-containing protein n=1 Tax=Dyadobacter chenwenxiniae TaxID=2906456 RepID=A0A9X1TD79_9BACT|nr:TPM domain-containing protein [Dyadobacter chenwenxiniae]MCF0053134.1 TPM domain-containing protein [Dyadobacter chenwenxiniae]MCF0061616.1 TPM domain-containing protein [Dyadobacter chenwenxiniae]UON81438.1 TPM domain-containing protein [Dyadobacter chenwenxiniae]